MKRDDVTHDLFGAARQTQHHKTVMAHAKRDESMKRATDHADRVAHAWSVVAFMHFERHARKHATFTSEDVRAAAKASGLIDPPDLRAWGTIAMRAARAGFIKKHGYGVAKNPDAHCRPQTIWRSTLICKP